MRFPTELGLLIRPAARVSGNYKSIGFVRSNANFTYVIDSLTVESVNSERDLGIIFTPGLDFSAHCEQMYYKALKTLGYVTRMSKEFKFSASHEAIFTITLSSDLF